uniref:Uncharacterized protein n=1 Tax=Plectus sambesii TaxID=2011161 RepID=A0A914VYA8_9BILA
MSLVKRRRSLGLHPMEKMAGGDRRSRCEDGLNRGCLSAVGVHRRAITSARLVGTGAAYPPTNSSASRFRIPLRRRLSVTIAIHVCLPLCFVCKFALLCLQVRSAALFPSSLSVR